MYYGTFSALIWGVHSRFFFATQTPNSQNHSYVHYSLSKFTGEWFTNRSNHIHVFTPITRTMATKLKYKEGDRTSQDSHLVVVLSNWVSSRRFVLLRYEPDPEFCPKLARILPRILFRIRPEFFSPSFPKCIYPLRRNDYQNNSINIFSCNCPGAITGFSCRAPENNSPKIVSCMGPCPVRAPTVIAPGALTGFSCRAPENNSKIIFSCL